MKIKKVKNQPKQITKYPEIDPKEQDAVESVNEIFKTPLTGAYNWDYIVVDDRIKKLYELGKKLNWNEDFDLDWSQDFPKDQFLINSDIFKTPEVELNFWCFETVSYTHLTLPTISPLRKELKWTDTGCLGI